MNFVIWTHACLLVLSIAAWLWFWRRERRSIEREHGRVVPGDLWVTCCRGGHAVLHRVVKPNDSLEAGPDSWVMSACDGARDGATRYMHAKARQRGEWLLVMRSGVPVPWGTRKLLCTCRTVDSITVTVRT